MTIDDPFALACAATAAVLWLVSRKWSLPRGTSATFIVCGALAGYGAGRWAASAGLDRVLAVAVGAGCEVLVFLALLGWRFYRDPDRTSANDPRAIVAPADGTVIYAKRVARASELSGTKDGAEIPFDELAAVFAGTEAVWLVGTAMVFTDVHVNRAPIAGTVTLRRHVPGRFLSLRRPEARAVNERAALVISNGAIDVAIVQIASRLVRQIVSYVDTGQVVAQGQRIGMIRFGSQVDLVIPARDGVQLNVTEGDRLVAGESVVCTLPPRE
jgi:phosphatidylserine decarboxylase